MIDGDFEEVQPNAPALMESLRAFGYDLPAAIADLVDNSIAASSQNIYIDFNWAGKDSHISVTDDGRGMTEDELREAMRPGTKNPLDDRESSDLGRFGLGLKTASFSQCRRLTVASKSSAGLKSVRVWDLDIIQESGKWALKKSHLPGSEDGIQSIEPLQHGTVVLWEKLDRVVGDENTDDEWASRRFLRLAERTSAWLQMIFHRFISGDNPRLNIFINRYDADQRLQPWDPFLESHEALHRFPIEPINIASGTVLLAGYVLPHKDKLGEEIHKRAGGPKGWNDHQGFYVYRNERLLVHGDWLGLGRIKPWRKELHYQLARIRVEISNQMDRDWQIDVKKCTAIPPIQIRDRLTELAEAVRRDAEEIFRNRGERQTGKRGSRKVERIWIHVPGQRTAKWRIDRDHALVQPLVSSECPQHHLVQSLLRVIEETVPRNQIWLDFNREPDQQPRPFDGAEPVEVRSIAEIMYSSLRRRGMNKEQAVDYLRNFDAFRSYHSLIEAIALTDKDM